MRRAKARKKAVCLLTAALLVFTMIPQTIAEAAGSTDKDISIEWSPEKEKAAAGEAVKVSIRAGLDEDSDVRSAQISVRLTEDEALLLGDISAGRGRAAERHTDEDGSVRLCFAVDKDEPEFSAEALFTGDAGTVDVTEDDIAVITEPGEDEGFTAAVEKNTASFSFSEKQEQNEEAAENTDNAVKENPGVAAAKAERNLRAASLPDDTTVSVDSYREGYSNSIFWIDNNNEDGIRPSGTVYALPELSFSMTAVDKDGNELGEATQYAVLTEDNMSMAGLSSMPAVSVNENAGVGSYLVTIGSRSLPSKVTWEDTYGDETYYKIDWKIQPRDEEGYILTDVTDENIDDYEAVSDPGWYYVLASDFSFNVNIRWGDLGSAEGITDAILDSLDFKVDIEGQDPQIYNLEDIKDDLEIITEDDPQNPDNPTKGVITIGGLWKYNLDGSLIAYSAGRAEGYSDGIHLDKVLEEGDYFAVIYDNSAAPNYGSVTDRLHDGGAMYLTLTGKTEYDAQKVWLDEGSGILGSGEERPGGEFQLWRYRNGQDPSTAAPVRYTSGDNVGSIVTLDINGQDNQDIIFKALDKYDPEGFRYVYVVREYLEGETADMYEQVFGQISEDGSITDMRPDADGAIKEQTGERTGTDTFLYNGGTLSNRISGTVSTKAEKVWKAAAFQAEFEDVTVELTLYGREKGSRDENDWEPARKNGEEITVVMDEFSAENLREESSVTAPMYDALGRELEYKWVETAVYQGGSENLLDSDADRFVLNQGGRDITYRSEAAENGRDTTVITNSIENTIKYDVEKIWLDEEGNETDAPRGAEVTFGLYRMTGEDQLDEDSLAATFTMDGKADEEAVTVNEELGIKMRETGDWKAEVSPLDEFDEEGRQYDYVLLELENTAGYAPSYETERTEEGYITTVTNAPGEGNRILVRKEWNDDSDIIHREPVTVEVRLRADKSLINTVTLGNGEGSGENIWQQLVGIGEHEPEDVYIVEVKTGETEVAAPDAGPSEDEYRDESFFYNGDNDTEYAAVQYTTDNHRYEAVYLQPVKAGVDTMYSVANRRLGTTDVKVTKNWNDGDGSLRKEIEAALDDINEDGRELSLVFRLDFEEEDMPGYYEMTRNYPDADTVTIGSSSYPVAIKDEEGKYASSIRDIPLDEKSSETVFGGLPKYDRSGRSVRYIAEEMWVDGKGKEVTIEDIEKDYPELYDLIKEYSSSSEDAYTVGGHRDSDTHAITVTNRLRGVKDVLWHKQWNDEYNHDSGQRSDIYLDIYQVTHDENGDPKTSLYRADYKWVYVEPEEGSILPDHLTDKRYHWHASFENLPKYDTYGYEIVYYAVEKTTVNKADFDYQDVAYSIPDENGGAEPAYIGTEFEQAVSAQQKGYVIDISGFDDSEGAHYALFEGGTFTNTIKKSVTINGQKLWASLPAGYPSVDLPTVTFTLYQKLEGDAESEAKPISTLTVSDWADAGKSGSYVFGIKYIGQNTMVKDEESGEMIIQGTGEGGAEPQELPKYDERGRMYTYTLEETSVDFDGAEPDESLVYSQATVNTYLVKNTYDSEKTSTAVKKYLKLPMKDGEPEAYPAVRFELTRTYPTSDPGQSGIDGQSRPELVDYAIWTSSEVKKAYEESETKDGILEKTLTFTGLDKYAPNGKEYVYTVREIKTWLGGYSTWAAEGDLGLEDVAIPANLREDEKAFVTGLALTDYNNGDIPEAGEIAIGATFLNAQDEDRETVEIEGSKVWGDYEDAFGLRPDIITLKLYRYADEQSNQGNPVPEAEVPENVYSITWNETQAGSWTYEIKGAEIGELEKYASNGMPWQYVVKEPDEDNGWNSQNGDDIYTVSPSGSGGGEAEPEGEKDGTVNIEDLVNSIKTSVPYSKSWVDSSGDIIDEDYLGVGDITVTFELQTAEVSRSGGSISVGEWQYADEYFKDAVGADEYGKVFGSYSFTGSITGKIDDSSIWGKDRYFEELPSVIKNEKGETVRLLYRAVETKIEFSGKDGQVIQTAEAEDSQDNRTYTYDFGKGLFEPAYYPDGPGQEADANRALTRDTYNRLKTTDLEVSKTWEGDRDNAYGTRPETERTGYDWETAFVIQKKAADAGEDSWENVQVYKGEVSEDLIIYLYGNDKDSKASAQVTGLPESDPEGVKYIYRAAELQPDPDRYADGHAEADKAVSEGEAYNEAYSVSYDDEHLEAVNTMETTERYAKKKWNGPAADSVTLELQYLTEDEKGEKQWASFENKAEVILDGYKDINPAKPYYEYEKWQAVWEDLPARVPGSLTDGDRLTSYRIVEKIPSGYVQVDKAAGTKPGTAYGETVFINSQKTSVTVEKKWSTVSPDEMVPVTVSLWRSTGEPGDGSSEPVADGDGGIMEAVLSGKDISDPSWSVTFSDLPKYNEEGEEYVYYAREDALPGFITVNSDSQKDDGTFSTIIRNIGRTELSGTKTWKDDHDAYGTRPDDIKLILERTEESGAWVEVDDETMKAEGISLKWENKGTDVWSYSFSGLPYSDEKGGVYSYRVSEASSGDSYAASRSGNDFVNTLSGAVDIPVVKMWEDSGDKSGIRPDSITVVLYANGEEKDRATLEPSSSEDHDAWSYVFKDLPEYDSEGKRIEYTVEEADIPEGYRASQDISEDGEYVLTNTAEGALEVTKTVSGRDGDRDRDFTFTVELTDTTVTGTYGDMAFEDGVASFTLSDGETAYAEGLPGGISYEVTEAEAGRDGYETFAENASGEIPAGDVVKARFINTKDIPQKDGEENGTKTGDPFNMAPFIGLMAASVLGIAAVAGTWLRRRR